jgi:protein-L-isoaspartate(D-aspartate) O-methyltransferase
MVNEVGPPTSANHPRRSAVSFIRVYLCSSVVALLLLLPAAAQRDDEARFRRLREQMVEQQLATSRFTGADPVRSRRVLEAMRKVPRHRFVPAQMVPYAYEDRPLPIGHGQTISQPYIVGRMTELVEPKESDRVLEIGTGSGYQAAVLAELVREVYTIEIVEPLGREAAERLVALGYKNVEVRIGNGYHGWPEKAPFDAIVVTAAPGHIPPPLLEQLAPGGRMIIPVGATTETQMLMLVTKGSGGPQDIRTRSIIPVRFVPFVGVPEP